MKVNEFCVFLRHLPGIYCRWRSQGILLLDKAEKLELLESNGYYPSSGRVNQREIGLSR